MGSPASSERGGYAAEPTLSLAAGESLIAGAGGEEGKSEIERSIDELSPLIRGGLIHSQLSDGFFGGEPDELVHSVGVGGRVIRFVGLLEDMGQRFGFAGTGGEEPRMA